MSLIHLRIYIIPTNEETATSDFVGFYFMEIWKTIKDYPDYQVSNLGRVKSFKLRKERILNPGKNKDGYYHVSLINNKIRCTKKIHQLVAIAFLNHKPCGMKLVIDHIDFNKQNNNINNLRILTNRENSSHREKKYTSKYTGVRWREDRKKWTSQIYINKKHIHLGFYKTEIEASNAYQEKIKLINT